jgi:dihydroorotate dehydrogenase (NAD+) catalytic subunit
MSVDLTTQLGETTFATPVMVASGCGGSGRELEAFADLGSLGAFVTRTVTLDNRADSLSPRTVETPAGLLTDPAPRGPGLQSFLATELPWLAQRGVRTVVSIAEENLGRWVEVARRVGDSPGVSGVEVNLAWPTETAARDSFQAAKIIAAVRQEMPRGVPVLAKVAADVHTAPDVARAVVKAGADAVVVGHGPPGLTLDPTTLRPHGPAGRLSGPATHAGALAAVAAVHQASPSLPLVASGGIRTGADALAMLAAGAAAVQVGSAVLNDPQAPTRVLAELAALLQQRGVLRVAEVVGRAHDTADRGPDPGPRSGPPADPPLAPPLDPQGESR